MTPPRITESDRLPLEIDNRYLAKQLLRIEDATTATKKSVDTGMLAWSGLADRVTNIEHRMHDVEQHIARPLPRVQRLFPFFRLAALVTLTVVGTLAIIAGLIVFTTTRS